jgi:hypothetical protein
MKLNIVEPTGWRRWMRFRRHADVLLFLILMIGSLLVAEIVQY